MPYTQNYTGSWVAGVKEGFGVMFWKDGDRWFFLKTYKDVLERWEQVALSKGQKIRQLRTRLHYVFIYVAQTVNTSNF